MVYKAALLALAIATTSASAACWEGTISYLSGDSVVLEAGTSEPYTFLYTWPADCPPGPPEGDLDNGVLFVSLGALGDFSGLDYWSTLLVYNPGDGSPSRIEMPAHDNFNRRSGDYPLLFFDYGLPDSDYFDRGTIRVKVYANLDTCLSSFNMLTPEWSTASPAPITRELQYGDCDSLRLDADVLNEKGDSVMRDTCGVDFSAASPSSLTCDSSSFKRNGIFSWVPTISSPPGATNPRSVIGQSYPQTVQRALTGTGSLLEQCGRSVIAEERTLVTLQDNGSGRVYDIPVRYDPICDGFTYSFTLWTNDGSYREFRYGSTRTFSVDNDEGGAAYYPFLDTTYFQMNNANPVTFTFSGVVTDSQGNEFIIPLGSQVEFKLITEFLDPDAAFCESNIIFPLAYDENGNEVVPTFAVPSDDASSFTFDISTYVNGVCRSDMYTDFFLSSDAGESIPCNRINYVSRPESEDGMISVTCPVALNTLSTTALYTINHPDVPADRPNSGAIPLAPNSKPTFRISRPREVPSGEVCARSVSISTDRYLRIDESNSGRSFDNPVQYDTSGVCDGLEYQLLIVSTDLDASYPGSFKTFPVVEEGTGYYQWDVSYNSLSEIGKPFTFTGQVTGPDGTSYPILAERQSIFEVAARFAGADASLCEQFIYFPDFAEGETTFAVSSSNSSSFAVQVINPPNGFCREEMFTDYFISSDGLPDIPCGRANPVSRPQSSSGLVVATCEVAWNALSTSALYTFNHAAAPAGRPNSGAVPLDPSSRPTFRVVQADANPQACADTLSYKDPANTVEFRESPSGAPYPPGDFNYFVTYDGEKCAGYTVTGNLIRPDGGDSFPMTPRLLEPNSADFTFAVNVADMDNQNTNPRRPYQFVGAVTASTGESVETRGPSFVFKYVYFPNTNECSRTISYPDLGQDYEIGSVDFLTTDTDNFSTRIAYSSDGYCARGQYIDLILTNTGGPEYQYTCDRYVPDLEYTGGGVINCNRVKGTMSTLVIWRLGDLTPENFGKRADSGVVYAGRQDFRVTHSDDAQATGGLRRRQRQVQAGLEIPSDIQCAVGHEICPVPGRLGSWECLDTQSMLDACGGCPQAGGMDCTEIAGISTVACEAGVCIVKECDEEHTLTKDASGCVPVTNSIRWSAI